MPLRQTASLALFLRTAPSACRVRRRLGLFASVCSSIATAFLGWSTARKRQLRRRRSLDGFTQTKTQDIRRLKGERMSKVRVLVGTRKGAFILESDGKRQKWDVSGPHFAGWEMYHLKGSSVDPNRIYASQSSGWFGQMIQRSDDGGKTWEPVDNKFVYDGVPGTHQWYDGTP